VGPLTFGFGNGLSDSEGYVQDSSRPKSIVMNKRFIILSICHCEYLLVFNRPQRGSFSKFWNGVMVAKMKLIVWISVPRLIQQQPGCRELADQSKVHLGNITFGRPIVGVT
jgi:hypothetical protein